MPYQKVTFLEDLPDVSEFDTREGYSNNNRSSQASHPSSINVPNRFIRNHSSPMHPESGMVNIPSSNVILDHAEEYEEPTRMQNNHQERKSAPMKHEMLEPFAPPPCQPNCQEIFFHIESCPLCKKFYKQDNTIYLVVIAVLLLICALMLKKILYP